ncbi:MAG: hypothetical protein SFU98_04640 [Leptospiraceae bacterium]|nr:hypothetical protein [Leptospiraceae bacterium]
MQTITIEVKNPDDMEVFLSLARRLDCKVDIFDKVDWETRAEKIKSLFKSIAERGTLAEAIPDPVEWQREIRKDKPLIGREY